MTQKMKYYINEIFLESSMVFISGAALQTFMLERGYGEEGIVFYSTAASVTSLATIFLASFIADRIKNVIRASALQFLLYIPLISALLFSSFVKGNFYGLLLTAGIFMNVGTGLYSILSYKLPYHIMDIRKYGEWSGKGFAYGMLAQFIFTAGISFLQKNIGFFPAMCIAYVVSLLFMVLMVLLTLSYKRIDNKITVSSGKKINLLKYKPFTIMILPTLLRGFGTTVFGFAVVIGYNIKVLDAQTAGCFR